MLPIQIPRLEPNQWRSLEKQLMAIAAKEKQELEPRDRKVNNSLPLAQNYASKLQWGDLFRFLVERNIVKVEAAITEVEIPQSAIAEPPPKPNKKPKSPMQPRPKAVAQRVCFRSMRHRLKDLLPQILYSDRAIGIQTIAFKVKELGLEITGRTCQDYLNQFSKEGLIFKAIAEHKFTAYALEETEVIDPTEWLPAAIAYRIAVANGYSLSYHFFTNRPHTGNPSKNTIVKFYASCGIEYRFDHQPMENQKWRALNGNAS